MTEIKTVPYVPLSHPFVERLIGTIRREYLDHMLFWTTVDLENKLLDFKTYFNHQRTHTARGRANPGSVRVTTNCQSPLISLAASLPILISDGNGGLTVQRLGRFQVTDVRMLGASSANA